jgi:zinc protease
LVYEDQSAVQVSGAGNFTEDPNLFFAIAIMNQGRTSAEGEKEMHGVLDALKTAPVSAEELEKAKNQEIAAFILGRQTSKEKADALGRYSVIGKNPNLINTDLSNYLKVTAADIERVARLYFTPTRATVLVIDAPRGAPQGPGPGQQQDQENKQ